MHTVCVNNAIRASVSPLQLSARVGRVFMPCVLFLHPTLVFCICAAAGDAAAADARSGRKTVDLEGLSFAQGGHLNTNKNTNLPPGSTRTTDKVHCVA